MRSSQEDITTEEDTLRARREAVKEQLKALRGDKPPKQVAEENRQKQLESREHKSAPTVMSSRRPVSRARTVVEPTHDSKRRDPRFDSLSAGPVNLDLLAKSYNFLPGLYEKEIKSLKATYDRLKRMEAHHAGPNAKSDQALRIREERQHVELALRRAESQRNERMRRETERNVKSRFKKENQRRVNAGLRPYFPKKGELPYVLIQPNLTPKCFAKSTNSFRVNRGRVALQAVRSRKLWNEKFAKMLRRTESHLVLFSVVVREPICLPVVEQV